FKALLFLAIAGSLYLFYHLRMNMIKTQKVKLEEQVEARTAEVTHQNKEIKAQRKALELVHSELLSSIKAAQEIQSSIFPSKAFIKSHLPQSFVYNKPKDVVSGDFCWFNVVEGKLII